VVADRVQEIRYLIRSKGRRRYGFAPATLAVPTLRRRAVLVDRRIVDAYRHAHQRMAVWEKSWREMQARHVMPSCCQIPVPTSLKWSGTRRRKRGMSSERFVRWREKLREMVR